MVRELEARLAKSKRKRKLPPVGGMTIGSPRDVRVRLVCDCAAVEPKKMAA